MVLLFASRDLPSRLLMLQDQWQDIERQMNVSSALTIVPAEHTISSSMPVVPKAFAAPPSPKVIRTLYRCLLNCSQQGAKPQVFGPHGTAAYFAHAKALGLVHFPSCALEVRRLLRHALTTAPPPRTDKDDNELLQDAFAVLRYAKTASAILFPKLLPTTMLPIFDYSSSAALPGEEVSFNFFEPRYLKLVEMASRNGGNYFMLRMNDRERGGEVGDGCSILLQIQKSVPILAINDGGGSRSMIGVLCAAGPRLRIKSQDFIDVGTTTTTIMVSSPPSSSSGKDNQGGDYDASKKTALPPLAVATQFEIWNDDDDDDDESSHDHDLEFLNQREEILDLLSSVLSDLNTNTAMFRTVGLPPLDATDFSFWALRFCLAESDVAARQKWLACETNQDRMNYVQDFLQFVLKQKQDVRGKKNTEASD